jgi:hypothetical protein
MLKAYPNQRRGKTGERRETFTNFHSAKNWGTSRLSPAFCPQVTSEENGREPTAPGLESLQGNVPVTGFAPRLFVF